MNHTAHSRDCHGQRVMDLGSELRFTDDGVVEVPYVSAAAAERPSHLLESDRKVVEEEEKREVEGIPSEYMVKPHRCRSRFCSTCCLGRGLETREKLIAVLESKYEAMQMWTLTVDPALFKSPEEAFEYVREKRCISEWVRTMWATGMLISRDYFCVVEWQKDTEMPHFHILLNTKFLDWHVALRRWGDFRPKSAGPVEGNRPAFGTVIFTEGNFENKLHAARYACAYLLKNPEHGYPDWVLDMMREVKRYQTSKGFWKLGEIAVEAVVSKVADDELQDEKSDGTKTSIRERITKCGSETVVLRVDSESSAAPTGKLHVTFVRKISVRYAEAMERLGVDEDYRGGVFVTLNQVMDLSQRASRRRIEVEPWDLGVDEGQSQQCQSTEGKAA